MNIANFDDEFGRERFDDMEEKIRHYRRALNKKDRSSEELPGIDIVEGLVEYCLENEKFEDAHEFCKLWIEYFPYSFDAWNKQAGILINLEKYPEALNAINKALSFDPGDPEALTNKAIILDYEGRAAEAKIYIDKALTLDPENDETLLHKGIILESLGDYGQALEIFKYLSDSGKMVSTALQELAFCSNALGKTEEAISYYKIAIDEDPFNMDLWYNLGMIYNDLSKHYKAIDCFDMAIAIDDFYQPAWYARGSSYSQLGRLHDAAESYRKSIELRSDDADSWHNLASALGDSGEYMEAIEAFSEAIRLEPAHYRSFFGRGICYDAVEDYEKAILDYDSALMFKSDLADIWYAKADALYNYGKAKDSLECYSRVLSIFPDDYQCMNDYGLTLLELGRINDAEKQFKNAINTAPEWADGYYSLAMVYTRYREYSMASELLRQSFDLDRSKKIKFYDDFSDIIRSHELNELLKVMSRRDIDI